MSSTRSGSSVSPASSTSLAPLLPHEIRERLAILKEKLDFLRGSL
ncbi:MAG: hypothetical protein ABI041_11315 [Bdellovibrionia bacterium]|jgi:hypothetical protein